MDDYIVRGEELGMVADALRNASGTNDQLSFPNGFVNTINTLSIGGGESGGELFVVTASGTTASHSASEIKAAHDAGAHCVMYFQQIHYMDYHETLDYNGNTSVQFIMNEVSEYGVNQVVVTVAEDKSVSVSINSYEGGGTGGAEEVFVNTQQPTEESAKLWVNPNGGQTVSIPQINDATTSSGDTWSSQKIAQAIAAGGGSGGGGSGEVITLQETILASGTIANGTAAGTKTETGLTLGDLRQWKMFAYLAISTVSGYYRPFIGTSSAQVLYNINGQRPAGVYQWVGTDKKLIDCVMHTAVNGNLTTIESPFVNINSSPKSYTQRFWYAPQAAVDMDDSTPVYMQNHTATTDDVQWKIVGILKYGE